MAILGVIGLDKILSQVGQIQAGMESKIDRAVQGAGIDCNKYAKQACPVDTGRLRSSIQYENKGQFKCICETTVNYAVFVEKGHHLKGGEGWVAAKPFLGPAYEQAKSELMDKLRSINWSV